jgi:glutamyl-queuosine tRNA(Asp) synthetase
MTPGVPSRPYVGRYAPSPTGDLHLGNAFAALVAWARARQQKGCCYLRIEDLDLPRVVPGAAQRIREDCAALGLSFDPFVVPPNASERELSASGAATVDDGVLYQSHRGSAYAAALQAFVDEGLVYACRCSRKDLLRAASAPHIGDEGPVYPGTCRDAGLPLDAPEVAWRLRIAKLVELFGDAAGQTTVVVDDAWQGRLVQDVVRDVGDFVVRRRDGVVSYQLAVVVDDRFQGVTEVVRGTDLLSSAPRQVLLHRALSSLGGGVMPPPGFAHLPLLVDESGARLSKRSAQAPGLLRSLLNEGGPQRVLDQLMSCLSPTKGAAIVTTEALAALPLHELLSRRTVSWRLVSQHAP